MKKQNKKTEEPSTSSGNNFSLSRYSESKSNSFQRIYDVVRKIPKGKVMTYGQVATIANVATPRVVGFALHVNKDPENIPCHRVVFSTGKLSPGYAFGGEDIQKEKLQKEGIGFNAKGEVLLDQYRFNLSS